MNRIIRIAKLSGLLTISLLANPVAAQQSHNNELSSPLAAIDEKLSSDLLEIYKARRNDYKPRTQHFANDGTPLYINRLIKEDSPYLLQHAHNPVNWYAWGNEAFETATTQNKPVFLSIGYATCHWCHVMERESFENEEIARQLNEQFIAIKVDREQLPDVDAMYMMGVQVTTGSGGWPLSGFLQPDGKLFHGATYMPPDIFSQVMHQVSDVWQADREKISEYANNLSVAIQENTNLTGEARSVGELEIAQGRDSQLLSFDSFQGGFGPAPKFPREATLLFLLDLAQRNTDAKSLEAADFTLKRMSAGGIHDQIGGGFHRYAVDDDWLIPHFEKMLYTQASLLQAYLQAFELTGNREHARTARRIADYVIRDMTSDRGGFYSATDADSEGEEGTYFIWEPAELTEILGESDAALAQSVWGVTPEGNFEDKNILHLQDTIENVAAMHSLDADTLAIKLNEFSDQLLQHRTQRVPPLTDRKIITAWNAMMSTALIKAGQTLNEPRYTAAATRSIDFLLKHNRQPDGLLWRAHFDNRSTTPASQADYAYLSQALLALYDDTGQKKWLNTAIALVNDMDKQFRDKDNGGYFVGPAEISGARLPVRPKNLFDNAAPTGNSVALRVLAQLWHRTGEDAYRVHAESLIASFSSWLAKDASGFSYFLVGMNDLLNGEVGAHRYAAKGKVKATVSTTYGKEIKVQIDVAPGWHINSNKPLQDYLIPSKLSLKNNTPLASVSYPKAITRKLGFQQSSLSLYEGSVVLTAALPENHNNQAIAENATAATADIELQLQACSDEICLAPETLLFKVPLAQLNSDF